jgi:REP element-mobilizing transposase RayT
MPIITSGHNRSMARWKNLAESGHTMFVSTTILGFVPVFKIERTADTIAAAILADCKHEEARVDAFVVMPEHVHLLLQIPMGRTGSELMDRLKTAWANRILDVATDKCRTALRNANRRLRSRSVWQRSFRGLVVEDKETWVQKLEYIHNNPVRRGLCERPEDYRWSSAKLWNDGCWKEGLLVEDEAFSKNWPKAIRDSVAVITRRVSATRGRVAR